MIKLKDLFKTRFIILHVSTGMYVKEIPTEYAIRRWFTLHDTPTVFYKYIWTLNNKKKIQNMIDDIEWVDGSLDGTTFVRYRYQRSEFEIIKVK